MAEKPEDRYRDAEAFARDLGTNQRGRRPWLVVALWATWILAAVQLLVLGLLLLHRARLGSH
jgi:hypothetical protein